MSALDIDVCCVAVPSLCSLLAGGCDQGAAGTRPKVTGDVPLRLGGTGGGRDRLLSSALLESRNPPDGTDNEV